MAMDPQLGLTILNHISNVVEEVAVERRASPLRQDTITVGQVMGNYDIPRLDVVAKIPGRFQSL